MLSFLYREHFHVYEVTGRLDELASICRIYGVLVKSGCWCFCRRIIRLLLWQTTDSTSEDGELAGIKHRETSFARCVIFDYQSSLSMKNSWLKHQKAYWAEICRKSDILDAVFNAASRVASWFSNRQTSFASDGKSFVFNLVVSSN